MPPERVARSSQSTASLPTARTVSVGLPFVFRPVTGLTVPVSTLSRNGGSAETRSRSPVGPASGTPCSGPGTGDCALAAGERAPVPSAAAGLFWGALSAPVEITAATAASFCVFTSPFERSAGGAQIWAIGAVKMRRPPSPESPVCFGGPVGGAYVHGYGQRENERRSPPAGRADERGVLACRQLQAAVRAWANTASQRPGGITAVVLAR